MTMANVKSFIKQAIAAIQGDDAAVLAEKIHRGARSAVSSQLSLLDGSLMDLEDAVEDAKEALRLARLNNGERVDDKNKYIKKLLDSHNTIVEAEDALEAHRSKIAFFQSELAELDSEEAD